MKKQDWIILLGALVVGGFIWAITERALRKEVESKAKKTEKDYLKLLTLYLEKQKSIPDEIKQQLINLRDNFIGIQDSVAIELKKVVDLIETGNEEIAIEKLAKVIENLLQEKYIKAGLAKDKSSCPKLFGLLTKAFELKWISKQEFNFSLLIKDVRNKEAHELAVTYPDNWKIISFLAGIEILYTLKGIRKNQV